MATIHAIFTNLDKGTLMLLALGVAGLAAGCTIIALAATITGNRKDGDHE